METKRTIGIADMTFAQRSGTLITYALGSCIGICLYDPAIKLGGLLHIMLPLNMETGRKNPLKYADTGMAEMIRQMEAKGANRARLVAKIAGGNGGGRPDFAMAGAKEVNLIDRALDAVDGIITTKLS